MSKTLDLTRRRTLGGLALTAALLAAPVTAGTAYAQDLSGELTFMIAEYSTNSAPYWEGLAASFMDAHPETTINIEAVNWQQMHDTTVQRIASGTLPDLVNTATIWLPEWVEADAIRTIGPDIVSDEVAADIIPSLLELGASYEGESWGLPIAAAGRSLFYNIDLLAEAGYDKPPSDWAGFRQAVVDVHEKTGAFGFAYDGAGVQAFRYFGFFLWNNGGDFFNEDGSAAFNSDAGVEALEFIVDLASTDAVPNPSGTTIEELGPMFTAGRLAMLINGNYFTAALRKDAPDLNFGVAAVPTSGPDVAPVAWGVTDTLVVAKDAPADLTKAFIDHIYTTEARTEFDTDVGLLPLLKSQASLPVFVDDAVTTAFVEQLPTARFDPLHPNYSQMQEVVKTAMQEALAGADAREVLDDAAETFNELIEE